MRSISFFPRLFALGAWSACFFSTHLAAADETDAPRPYPACKREPTENDVSAAKGAFEAGQVSFHEADYDRAILYWEDAFRRDCTAVPLLTNLARAYELANKKRSAVNALEAFLERRPESPDRPSIEKRIEALKKQVERESATAGQTPAPGTAEPSESPRVSDRGETTATTSEKPAWPVILTSGGILLAGVGLPLMIDGQSKLDFYRSKCPPNNANPPQNECRSDRDGTAKQYEDGGSSAVTQRNIGTVATIAGGTIAVGGAILWYLLWNQEERPSTAVTPLVGPGFAGWQLSGQF